MPRKQEGETKDEFIERCVPEVIEDGTAENGEQAVAVCNSLWEDGKAVDYHAEIERVRQAWDEAHPSGPAVAVESGSYSWVERVRDASIIVEFNGKLYEVAYTDTDDGIEFATPDEWIKVERIETYEPAKGNALKAINTTDDELIAANYIILFGDENNRDLEGIASEHKNADGTVGEFFTSETVLDSDYTITGRLLIDWEHGAQPDGNIPQPGRDDILGYVDWKSARVDKRGVWVERVLSRHNEYMEFLEVLIDQGIIGTSSEPVSNKAKAADNGEITDWPLKRDTLTVMPMEWRQKWDQQNVLQAMKGLADLDDAFKSLLPEPDETPEQEPSAGDAGASREVELKAKSGRARAEQLLIKIEQLRR